jgi:hypothetical protein
MKLPSLVTLLLFANVTAAFAQTNESASKPFTGYPSARWPKHEKPDSEEYKLSHDDFVTTYGVTDTAAAIIHMYLVRHNFGLRLGQVAAALTSSAGYVASAQADVEATNNGQAVNPSNREYPSWVVPVLVVGGGSALYGFVHASFWSRRECYNVLYTYHKTHQLPAKVRHRLTKYLIKTRNHEYDDYSR